VHCDVRPANVVVEPPRADEVPGAPPRFLLVDWGLCADAGTDVVNRGVAAFAASAVFEQSSCVAHARLDLAAVAYTWLAVAHGSDACAAPWAAPPLEVAAEVLGRRNEWIAQHADAKSAVALLFKFPRAAVSEADYDFPGG
jgi:hypothetical protein